MPPVEGDHAQGLAGELGHGVMRHGLALIEKERDVVPGKESPQHVVVAGEGAHKHGAIAVPAALAHEGTDRPRGLLHLMRGRGALGDGDGQRVGRGLRIVTGPVAFQPGHAGRRAEAAGPRLARQLLHLDLHAGHTGERLVAPAVALGRVRPAGKPGEIVGRAGIEAERQVRLVAEGNDRRQEGQLLGRQLGEAIEPQRLKIESGARRLRMRGRMQRIQGVIGERLNIVQLVGGEPFAIDAAQEREVAQLPAQAPLTGPAHGEARQALGRVPVALELSQHLAQLPRKAGHARRAAIDPQVAFMPHEQRAQDHHAPLLVEQWRHRASQAREHMLGQALEGKDPQAGVPGQLGPGEQLALQLKRGLLGRQQHKGTPLRRGHQPPPQKIQAPPGLATACRAQYEAHPHAAVLAHPAVQAKDWVRLFGGAYPPRRRAPLLNRPGQGRNGCAAACPAHARPGTGRQRARRHRHPGGRFQRGV